MQLHDDSQRRSELRLAFLKHLPQRVDHLVARARAFCESGWDINGQALLTEDLQRLAGAAGTHGAIEASQLMLSVDAILADCLLRESVPDDAGTAQLASLLEAGLPLEQAFTALLEQAERPFDADHALGIVERRLGDAVGVCPDGPDVHRAGPRHRGSVLRDEEVPTAP